MSRKIPNWIDGYLTYMKDTEPPVTYFLWTAIATIAGALQRRVYMPWGHNKIFPNMFIFLMGRSGLGKGIAMGPAYDMFKNTGLPIAPDAVTIQELIRVLEGAENQFENTEGLFETHSSLSVYARELAVLLGQRDIKKLAHLTDWYDSHDTWKNSTKTQGKEDLIGVCLNILGAAAPDWLPTMIPPEAIGGGFTSRIIFILESTKGQINPWPVYNDKLKRLKDDLISDLCYIATHYRGEFLFSPKAREAYEKYYIKQEKEIERGVFPVKDMAFEGYANRRALHLRKMSMVLATARQSEGIVELKDFQNSLTILSNAESKMSRLFSAVGRGFNTEALEKVMSYILQFKQTSRAKILRTYHRDVDAQSIQIVEDTMRKMNFIAIEYKAGDAIYTLNENWEG